MSSRLCKRLVQPGSIVGLLLLFGFSQASAQVAMFDHKVEIHGFGGYVWSSSQTVGFAPPPQGLGVVDLDLESSAWWGVALDINLPQGTQVELLFTRQDTDLTSKPQVGSKETLSGIVAEFYHVGGVYTRYSVNNVHPFTSFTLGATRFVSDRNNVDDVWKFSIVLGLGVKAYMNERFGLRAQARMPWTFINSGAGIGFGTGGVSAGVTGSGIVGFDLSGGVFLMM